MLHISRSTRSDDRNGELISQRSKSFIGISGFHTVMIHAGKKNFTGTAFLSFLRPCQQFPVRFDTPAIKITFPAILSHLCIYGKHTNL